MRASRAAMLALLCAARARAEEPPAELSLADAYARASAISETVRTAEENVRESRARYRGALSLIGPQIALTVNGVAQNKIEAADPVSADLATGNLSFKTSTAQPLLQLNAGATLVQPLFRRGVFPARTAGQRGIESSEATLKRTREQLAIDVTEAFVQVMELRELARIAQGAVKRAEEVLALAKARIKAGGALPSAELLAQVSLEGTRLRAVRAAGDARASEVGFARLVGVDPPARLALPPLPAAQTLMNALDEARGRSDLRAAELKVRQSESLEGQLAGNLFWPKLDLAGSYLYSYPAEFGVSHAWSVGPVLTVPLLQTGDEWTQLKLQSIQTQVLTLDRSLLGKQVTEQVRRAAVEVDTAEQAAKVADQQLAAAQHYYDLIQRQLKLGAVTFLEVTIAQNTLTDAESQRTSVGFEQKLAIYRLLFATGGLKL